MTRASKLPRPEFPTIDQDAWEAKVSEGIDLSRMRTVLDDGIEVDPLYPTPAPARVVAPRSEAAPWAVAQEYREPSVAKVVEAIALDADYGLGAAWVRLDAATRFGFGADSEGGAPLATAADVRSIRSSLGDRPLWLDGGAGTDALRAAWGSVPGPGGLLLDPLGALAEGGGLGVSLAEAMGAMTQGIAAAAPRQRAVLTTGGPYHDAGASPVQELAVVFANLFEVLRAADATGVEPGKVLAATVVRLVADSDLFVSIAKFRAARWLWQGVADKAGASGTPMFLSGRMAWRNRTRHDPWVNLLRTTVETFAGATGGADEVVAEPFSRVLGTPRADARRWAMGAGTLLREESHLAQIVDPAAGSGYVEALTHEISQRAWAFAQEIEREGGLYAALSSGWVQDRVAACAQERDGRLRRGRDALTGVTVFTNLDEGRVDVGPVPDPGRTLSLAPVVSVKPLPRRRLAEPFEALRDASDAHQAATGKRPAALLVTAGERAEHRPRLEFVRSLLAVGGFETVVHPREALATLPQERRWRIAVICAADEQLPSLLPELASELRARGCVRVLVAGKPAAAGNAASVADDFIHRGVDIPAVLAGLQDVAEVSR